MCQSQSIREKSKTKNWKDKLVAKLYQSLRKKYSKTSITSFYTVIWWSLNYNMQTNCRRLSWILKSVKYLWTYSKAICKYMLKRKIGWISIKQGRLKLASLRNCSISYLGLKTRFRMKSQSVKSSTMESAKLCWVWINCAWPREPEEVSSTKSTKATSW